MKILQSNDLQADIIYFDINGKRLKITKVEDFYILLQENNEKQFEACLYKKATNLQSQNWLNGLIAFESYEDYLFYSASKETIEKKMQKDFNSIVDNFLSRQTKNEDKEVQSLKDRLEKAVKTNNNFAIVLWLLSAGFITFGYFIK